MAQRWFSPEYLDAKQAIDLLVRLLQLNKAAAKEAGPIPLSFLGDYYRVGIEAEIVLDLAVAGEQKARAAGQVCGLPPDTLTLPPAPVP